MHWEPDVWTEPHEVCLQVSSWEECWTWLLPGALLLIMKDQFIIPYARGERLTDHRDKQGLRVGESAPASIYEPLDRSPPLPVSARSLLNWDMSTYRLHHVDGPGHWSQQWSAQGEEGLAELSIRTTRAIIPTYVFKQKHVCAAPKAMWLLNNEVIMVAQRKQQIGSGSRHGAHMHAGSF